MKKIIHLPFMVLLIFVFSFSLSSKASALEALAGQTITIPYYFNDVTKIDGAFVIIGEEYLESITYDMSGISMSGSISSGTCSLSSSEAVSGNIKVILKVKDRTFTETAIISIGFTYKETDEDGNTSDAVSKAYAVYIVSELSPEEPGEEIEEELEEDPEEEIEEETEESPEPTVEPTVEPTPEPTIEPTPEPTEEVIISNNNSDDSDYSAVLSWFIPLIVVLALAALSIYFYTNYKKKKLADNIPLIDYDIDDDF